jgi:hypothetical protein
VTEAQLLAVLTKVDCRKDDHSCCVATGTEKLNAQALVTLAQAGTGLGKAGVIVAVVLIGTVGSSQPTVDGAVKHDAVDWAKELAVG